MPTTANQHPSILERFPPEIRNEVFRLCLVSPTGYLEPVGSKEATRLNHPQANTPSALRVILLASEPITLPEPGKKRRTTHPSRRRRKAPAFITTSLLRVSSKLRPEAEDLFWHKNTFLFSSSSKLARFYQQIDSMALARIPNISVSIDDCISFPAFGPATHLSSPLRKMLHPLLAAATSAPKLKRLELTIRASVLTDIYRSVRDCRYRKVLTALEAIESVLPETVCEKWGDWEEEIGFEKEIVVVKERDGLVCAWGRCREEEMLDEVEKWELVCQDLNNFFGGRLSWGKEGMLWDERERAGNLSGICAEIRKKHEAEDNE